MRPSACIYSTRTSCRGTAPCAAAHDAPPSERAPGAVVRSRHRRMSMACMCGGEDVKSMRMLCVHARAALDGPRGHPRRNGGGKHMRKARAPRSRPCPELRDLEKRQVQLLGNKRGQASRHAHKGVGLGTPRGRQDTVNCLQRCKTILLRPATRTRHAYAAHVR